MIPKHKVKLSPRLQLGIGRKAADKSKILTYSTLIILVISGVLGIRAVKMVISKGFLPDAPIQGQVAGATDTPAPLFEDYSVNKGETVFSIAQTHNIDWTALATINNLKAPFALKQGQILKIPKQ
jgi:hypothetical protein